MTNSENFDVIIIGGGYGRLAPVMALGRSLKAVEGAFACGDNASMMRSVAYAVASGILPGRW